MPSAQKKEAYQLGDKLVIVASRALIKKITRPGNNPTDGLHFVELTITERKDVGGTYHPENNHVGFRATGTDGWGYVCQWSSFDETATTPYQVWLRDYVDGVHYTTDAAGKVDKWLIPDVEFTEHYVNYCVTIAPGIARKEILDELNKKFPNTQVFICDVVSNSSADPDSPTKYPHSSLGIQYKSNGCFMCQNS